ncbi:MAG: hypothetical protein QM757_12025 [Paludibaculum sp.]
MRDLPGLNGMVGKRGLAKFSVPAGGLSVLGLRFGGEAFTSIPTAPPSGTSFALPQLAFGGGWYTALYFSNTTANALSVTANFIGEDGNPLQVPYVRRHLQRLDPAPTAPGSSKRPTMERSHKDG